MLFIKKNFFFTGLMIGGLIFRHLGAAKLLLLRSKKTNGSRGIPFVKKKLHYWFNVGPIVVVGFSNTTHKI